MGYPVVRISNSTNFMVNGTVSYASVFCSNDDYAIAPLGAWQASSRGTCLLTGISATVYLPDGTRVQATSYDSSGTSYSEFSVIQLGDKNFAVTRVITKLDSVGDIEAEPTEFQK